MVTLSILRIFVSSVLKCHGNTHISQKKADERNTLNRLLLVVLVLVFLKTW